MIHHIVRRVLISIPVLWGLMTLVFIGFHMVPGDPVQAMIGQNAVNGAGINATSQDAQALRHQLGLDRSLPIQYTDFLTHAARGDFGRSYSSGRPVWTEIRERFPYTAELAVAAWLLSIVFGISTGVMAAVWNPSILGTGVTTLAVIGMSLPGFWLGTMLAFFFGVELHWLPVAEPGGISHLVLPAVTVAIVMTGRLTRQTRAALVDILGADYIRTARAKGLRFQTVVIKHALRNALLPLVTIVGLEIAGLLGGVVIIENVFAWPGLGTLAVGAVSARDYPVIAGTTCFFAIILILTNLVVDISYHWLDPRIAAQ